MKNLNFNQVTKQVHPKARPSLFLIALILLALTVTVFSVSSQTVKALEASKASEEKEYTVTEFQRMYDLVGELTPEEATDLRERLAEFTRKTGQNLIYVISNDMEGKRTRDYGADFYDELFPEDPANGAILLLDLENRELNLVTSGSMVDIVTDYDEETVYDAAWDNLVSGNYYGVGLDAIKRLEDLVARGVVIGHTQVPEQVPPKKSISLTEVLVSAGIALVTGGGFYGATASSYKAKPKKMGYNFGLYSLVALAEPVDTLVNSSIRLIPRVQATGSSGSSSGPSKTSTTTFKGSSGRTHGGGGGRKF